MARLRLDIVDRDADYAKSLASYATDGFTPGFTVRAYTDADAYLNETASDTRADIILAGEGFADTSGLDRSATLVVRLGEGADDERPTGGSPAGASLTVNRYENADALLKRLVRVYADSDRSGLTDTGFICGEKAARVSLAYSREGGAGRTSLAIALCERLARMGRRALYLCLDWGGGADFNTKSGEPGVSDIIYALKSKRDKLKLKFSALSRECPISRVNYFAKPDYPMDLDELDARLASTLIAKLRGSGLFDDVVIDAHSGLSRLNAALIETSDVVFVVANGYERSPKALHLAVCELCGRYGEQAAQTLKKLTPVAILDRNGEDETDGAGDRERIEDALTSLFAKTPDGIVKMPSGAAIADFTARVAAIRTSRGVQGFTRSVLGLGADGNIDVLADALRAAERKGRP